MLRTSIEIFKKEKANRFAGLVMKKPATQLSFLLTKHCKQFGNEEVARKLRRIIRNGNGNYVHITGFDVRDWRTKQTFPHSPEAKRALIKYFNKETFSALVLSEHNLGTAIRNVLYYSLKEVITDNNKKYRAYDMTVLSAALNINASPATLTQAIILNYLYSQAQNEGIDDIKLIELDDLHHLISFVVNALKEKNGMPVIDKHITQIWDDLTLQKIDFRSIDKIVLRDTLSILWNNSDYLI